ncbi:MAG TPA: lysylphosphatidylglycerol synthase transmembrane domain-containing protein [Flavipsychrobacter sp.]|nr:lysylphosphatidylglycerol synthase transmembrane domain-containing protein [Flavipsychrobacter sp.]
MTKKTLLTVLQYVFFFGLGALLIKWQYGKLTSDDKEQIMVAFQQVRERIWLIAPVIVVGFLSHLFRALRWKILLEPVNLKPHTTNVTFAVLIGYLVNLLVPRMGEVARCSVLAKYEKEPVDKIVGTIVAERSFDLVCLVFVSLLTYILQMKVANEYVRSQLSQMNFSGSSLAIVGFLTILFVALLVFIYRRSKKTKVGKILTGLGEGVMSIFKMKKRALFLFYTVMIWMCYLSLIVFGFKAIEATEHLGGLAALSVLVFGSLGMIVTPGGIGAYPIAVQGVLMNVYAINKNFALAFGWVSWMAQTAIVLMLGLLSLLLLPIFNARQNKMDH